MLSFTGLRLKASDAIVGLCLAAVAVVSLRIKLIRTDFMFGDTAVIFQAAESVLRQGQPLSQAAGAFGFFNHYIGTPVHVLQRDMSQIFANPTTFEPISVFQGHFYFILYLLAPLGALFGVPPALLGADIAAFVGLLVLAYVFLRGLDVPSGVAALFLVLVAIMPAWWQALAYGQFYPDRIFLFSGFAVAALAMRSDVRADGRSWNIAFLIAAVVLCMTVDERGGIIAGIFLLAHSALYFRMPGMRHLPRIGTGAAAFTFGYVLLKYMLPHQAAYSSFLPGSWADLVAIFTTATFVSQMPIFLTVNAPLLVLGLFAPRALAIAVVMMIPSVIGNIGGAEKTGWSTHYPSFYFPILVWAACLGYAKIVRLLGSVRFGTYVAALPLAALIAFESCTSPNATPVSISWSNIKSGFYPNVSSIVEAYLPSTIYRANLKTEVAAIQAAVPEGALVTSVERGMELLHVGRLLEMFPADIDRADYAVVSAEMRGGILQFGGSVDFAGPSDSALLDRLAIARMKLDGYGFDKAMFFPSHGLAVVRRTPPQAAPPTRQVEPK